MAPPLRTAGEAHSLNILIVEEFEGANGKARSWTKVGVAFPHADGVGFNLELKAFLCDGKLVVLPPPLTEERAESAEADRTAISETAPSTCVSAGKTAAR